MCHFDEIGTHSEVALRSATEMSKSSEMAKNLSALARACVGESSLPRQAPSSSVATDETS